MRILTLIAIVLLAPGFSHASDVDVSNAKSSFDFASEMVFPIRTALSDTSPKASYGSAFVVSRSGILATNYHVAASYLTSQTKYKLFVTVKNVSIEAKVVAVDVIHDLVLVKIPHDFTGEFQVNGQELSTGEKVFSVGQPEDLNMSIVEGNYNGTQKLAPYEHIVLSSPINPGMSGGPTLDQRGRVVGVNVSILRDAKNISFAVPTRYLTDLIKEVQSRTPATGESPNWETVIQAQLEQTQEKLTQDWIGSKVRAMGIKGWRVMGPLSGMKCWEDQLKMSVLTINQLKKEVQDCSSSFSIKPEKGVDAGNFSIRYVNLNHSDLSTPEYYHNLETVFGTGPKHTGASELYTASECTNTIVVNHNDVKLKVNFCVAGLKRYGKLNNAVIQVVTLDKAKNSLMVDVNLEGFSETNLKKVVETLVESVEKVDNADS